MKKLIEEAKRIHAQAFEELERGAKLNNELLIKLLACNEVGQ
jgi:hypothetical protein